MAHPVINQARPRVDFRVSRQSGTVLVVARFAVPGPAPRQPVDLTGRACHVVLAGQTINLTPGADGMIYLPMPAAWRSPASYELHLADVAGGPTRERLYGVIEASDA